MLLKCFTNEGLFFSWHNFFFLFVYLIQGLKKSHFESRSRAKEFREKIMAQTYLFSTKNTHVVLGRIPRGWTGHKGPPALWRADDIKNRQMKPADDKQLGTDVTLRLVWMTGRKKYTVQAGCLDSHMFSNGSALRNNQGILLWFRLKISSSTDFLKYSTHFWYFDHFYSWKYS